MSRNGPIFSGARAQAQARQPLPDDPFTAPPTGQSAPQWPPQYVDPQAQHAPQPVFAQHAPAPQQQGYAPQPAYGQPQPIAYGHPPQPRQPQAFGAQDAHAQQPSQGYYFPQAQPEPEPAPAYAPQAAAGRPLPFESLAAHAAPSFGQQAQQPQTTPRWPSQQPDPRGFDLGNYMPATAPSFPPAEQSQFHQGRDAAHFQPGDPGQHHADLDPGALPRQHDPARFESSHGYGENDADYDEILAEEEEQPRRGRRGMMIAAALVGAIGLGGALAYTYKTFFAASSGPAPRITASNAGPNKVKPVVPDGKSFPNTDKKLLNRLGEEESANPAGRVVIGVPPPPQSQQEASDDRASEDPNAPRKVRIIPITPNSPPQGAMPVTTGSAPAKPPGIVMVPGVTLENIGPPQGPPSAARVALPPTQPQAQARAAPPPPPAVRVASAAPEPVAPPVRKAAPAATEPAAKAPVPKTKTASVAPAAAATAATGSGYVAVLSSKKSRMDALKTFADMQEKYGDVLASKTPDVQESDQSARGLGTMYRLVVGPPGSREAASNICSKLKAAGYKDCWVTQY